MRPCIGSRMNPPMIDVNIWRWDVAEQKASKLVASTSWDDVPCPAAALIACRIDRQRILQNTRERTARHFYRRDADCATSSRVIVMPSGPEGFSVFPSPVRERRRAEVLTTRAAVHREVGSVP